MDVAASETESSRGLGPMFRKSNPVPVSCATSMCGQIINNKIDRHAVLIIGIEVQRHAWRISPRALVQMHSQSREKIYRMVNVMKNPRQAEWILHGRFHRPEDLPAERSVRADDIP